MKKNIKIAKELLALAKDIVAINDFEKKISPKRLITVWNEKYGDVIERVKLLVQYRDAISQNLSTIQDLRNKLGEKLAEMGDKESKIVDFLNKLESNPTLLHNFDFTINKKQQRAMSLMYPYVEKNRSYAQKIQTGMMEELFVLDHAIQLMQMVASNEFMKAELPKYLGMDKKLLDSLVKGVAPDFLKEMEEAGYSVETGKGERDSLKGVGDFLERKEKEFDDSKVNDHKIRINDVEARLRVGAENSLLIIQKLNDADKYLSEVLTVTSFTNASLDKTLGQNFEKNNGVWVPSAKGGEFTSSDKTAEGMKTAGVMDTLKNLAISILKGLSKLYHLLQDFLSRKEEFSTKEMSEQIIGSLEFKVN